MPQDNNDACPACRSDGLTVSKVNGITQIEVPQDYAFARHGGIGPQIQRAMTHANSAGNSTPAHSTHASHAARLSAESNVDQSLARADADVDPGFALLHPDFTPDVLQPRSPDAIVAETLPHSCGVFSRWPSDMEVTGNSLPASTGARLAAANAGRTTPWNYLELSGSIRVPSDLGENARKDYDKLPDEVKKFLRKQGLPEGVDKDSDQQSLIHLIYLIFRNAKGNRIPLGKGSVLGQKPPGTPYDRPVEGIPAEKCGYRRLYNFVDLRYAIDWPLYPDDFAPCCYTEYRGPALPIDDRDVADDSIRAIRLLRKQQLERTECIEQQEAALAKFVARWGKRSWDNTQLQLLIQQAFSEFGFPQTLLLSLLYQRTSTFTCEPDCDKRIALNTWSIQVKVHPSNPMPHTSKKPFTGEQKSWKDSSGRVHEYETTVICEGANVWLTVSLVFNVSFWLECLQR